MRMRERERMRAGIESWGGRGNEKDSEVLRRSGREGLYM